MNYADVLMQQEHLSRQQRIRLVQKATQRKGRSRPAVLGIHDAEVAAAGKARPLTPARPMAAAGKARSITPAGPTTTCHGTMHGKVHKTKDHSEHGMAKAVGKAKQGHANNASSRGNTNTRREAEVRLARQIEQNGREDVAEQHYLKAVLLKVWRALSSVTEIALLQKVKAERHHQYCVLHLIWINLIHNVSCSRAHKTEQVRRVVLIATGVFLSPPADTRSSFLPRGKHTKYWATPSLLQRPSWYVGGLGCLVFHTLQHETRRKGRP